MRELLRGRLRWLLVAWMFAISATAYLDRVNISIAGPILQKEFGLSNTQLGYVFSAFVVGYALFQIVHIKGGKTIQGVLRSSTVYDVPNLALSNAFSGVVQLTR